MHQFKNLSKINLKIVYLGIKMFFFSFIAYPNFMPELTYML